MNNNLNIFVILLFGIFAVWLIRKFSAKFKLPKIGAMTLVTGGVKCGKSTFSVALALKEYKRAVKQWNLRKFFSKVFFKKFDDDKPLLYSNVPLSVPYVPLTKDLLTRKERFVYGSIIYMCESSLVADSQMIKDKELNQQLLMFHKLIGHETKGGKLIMDTQSVLDTHYSCKRCLSEYIYIHHLVKWIPFFLVAFVREERYSEDGANVYNDDVEQSLKRVIIPKSTWKKFDSYCYSSLTDNLPVNDKVVIADTLKAKKIISFRGDIDA